MSSPHHPKPKANPIPAENYYAFGQKSAALLGILLTGDGEVTAFAYHRPSLDITKPWDSTNDMTELYRSKPITLKAGTVPFLLTLAPDKVGMLTIEPRGWTNIYEVYRTHFLGLPNPFGDGEIPYDKFDGTNRPAEKEPNRVFKGVFSYDPDAIDAKQRATVTLIDVESGGQSKETISISAFDDPINSIAGGILIAIRVNVANYSDGCASLEFTGGHVVSVPIGGNLQPRTKLVLNTTADTRKGSKH